MDSLRDPFVENTIHAWDTRAGAHEPPPVAVPYPSPADWRDHWIYFLLVDRFDNPSSNPRHADPSIEYQGGNFAGILKRLDYLKELGVGALWFSPVLANPPWFHQYWGGYAAYDLLHVEPRFCSDPRRAALEPESADREFRDLVDKAHEKGLYVILDIVLNHAGNVFSYEGKRDEAPWNERGEYRVEWKNAEGKPLEQWREIETIENLPHEAGVWPREFQHNVYFRRKGVHPVRGDIARGDFGSLKEFATDFVDPATGEHTVRNLLIQAYQYLIARFDIDGYRIDTLQYVEPEFARIFGNAMREYALSIGKINFFTFGEVWRDDEEEKIAEFVGRDTARQEELVGVDAAIDFPMRKRLVDVVKGFAPPAELALHFDRRREALRRIVSSHGEASRYYVTFLDNHDLTARFHRGDWPDQTKLALTCLMTMQGIPCVYYGTEAGLSGQGDSREAVREALWGRPDAFSSGHEFYRHIRELSELRGLYPALRYGRQYFRSVSGNGVDFGHSPYRGGVIAFSRILNDHELLVAANTHTREPASVHVVVDKYLNPVGREWKCVFPDGASLPAPLRTEETAGRRTVRVTLAPMEALVLA